MRLIAVKSVVPTLVLLLASPFSLPSAAAEVGAKAIFDHDRYLEVKPVAGGVRDLPQRGQPLTAAPAPRDAPPSGGQSAGSGSQTAAPRPVAVRYCLRRVDGSGRVLGDAPLGEIFQSGERVQLTVESNSDGLLAIVQHGSDGHRGLLYPPPSGDLGAAPIQARRPIVLPSPRHSFTFDGTPGTERLWLVLGRDRDELAALPLRDRMDDGDLAVLQLLVDRETGAKNLVVETLTQPGDPCTYAANVTGRVVIQEIALAHR